jgi:hypothetical protein
MQRGTAAALLGNFPTGLMTFPKEFFIWELD